jgi:hypothetical protein
MLAAFIAVLHLLVVGAHDRVPPQLDESRFLALAVTFSVTMVVTCLLHTFHTRRV